MEFMFILYTLNFDKDVHHDFVTIDVFCDHECMTHFYTTYFKGQRSHGLLMQYYQLFGNE